MSHLGSKPTCITTKDEIEKFAHAIEHLKTQSSVMIIIFTRGSHSVFNVITVKIMSIWVLNNKVHLLNQFDWTSTSFCFRQILDWQKLPKMSNVIDFPRYSKANLAITSNNITSIKVQISTFRHSKYFLSRPLSISSLASESWSTENAETCYYFQFTLTFKLSFRITTSWITAFVVPIYRFSFLRKLFQPNHYHYCLWHWNLDGRKVRTFAVSFDFQQYSSSVFVLSTSYYTSIKVFRKRFSVLEAFSIRPSPIVCLQSES